jgi:hypothetical protein
VEQPLPTGPVRPITISPRVGAKEDFAADVTDCSIEVGESVHPAVRACKAELLTALLDGQYVKDPAARVDGGSGADLQPGREGGSLP